MSESHYFQGFMDALQRRIPQKATLANTITDILAIDKDAVYRRLRGEVNFSFIEMANIAKKIGISLDSIVGIESTQSKPTHVNMPKHVNPSALDYRMFNDYIDFLKLIKDEPQTQLLSSGNTLPHYLFYDFEQITKLYISSWSLASWYGVQIPYNELVIPEQMKALHKESCYYLRHIKSTKFVWDRFIIQRLVENILFFHNLRFITKEDVLLLKNELFELLNYVENLAVTGRYEDTGNEVSIYISDIYIDTCMSCFKTQNMMLCQFKVFLLNSFSAYDEEVYNEVENWILSLQRMATLITISGGKIRSDYFNTQRKIINTL